MSRLLALPTELQLQIYELVLVAPQPLLLNHACNSSLAHNTWTTEKEAWEKGEKKAPVQPALTRLCRSIRKMTLPIWYGENVFRAGYCRSAGPISNAVDWLRAMGKENREMLKNLYFYDANRLQDFQTPRALDNLIRTVLECGFFNAEHGDRFEKDVGGDGDGCCAHWVGFGRESEINMKEKLRVPGEMDNATRHRRPQPGETWIDPMLMDWFDSVR